MSSFGEYGSYVWHLFKTYIIIKGDAAKKCHKFVLFPGRGEVLRGQKPPKHTLKSDAAYVVPI